MYCEQRGDIARGDDAANRIRVAQLLTALFEIVAEQLADSGVSTKPAAMRLTRTGAVSIARLAMSAGNAAVSADVMPRPSPEWPRRRFRR